MCHVCQRLGIVVEGPPPGLIEQENAEQEYLEQKQLEYYATRRAQGIPQPPAPRKVLRSTPTPKVVVEPAPSHDGAPTFAAWSVSRSHLDADPTTEDGYSDSPPKQETEKHRPKFGIRVYDATEDATAERAAQLARRIFELTYAHRTVSCEQGHEDRIEVVALPLPASMAAEEKALQCVAHNRAELVVRLRMQDAALAASWYIMAEDLCATAGERKQMWVITDLKNSWEEELKMADGLEWSELREKMDQEGAHGHFLAVSYDVASSWYDDEDDEGLEKDKPRHEFFAQEYCLGWLGNNFYHFIDGNLRKFEEHFVAKGVLDAELVLARAAASGVEVPRPVVIPLHLFIPSLGPRITATDKFARDQPVWHKFMRVANWIDLVCYYADQQINWQLWTDGPKNSAGPVSLRALWAFFIENWLKQIETNAAQWTQVAAADYKRLHGTQKGEPAWSNSAFGPGGWATPMAARFPRVPATNGGWSEFGVFANEDMTIDGKGETVRLGPPLRI